MVRTNQAQPVNLPPAAWLASFAQSKRLVDQFELQRATWLLDRRPRFVLVEEQNDESKDNNPPPKNLRAVTAFDVAGLLIAAGLAFFGATLLTFDLYWDFRRQPFQLSSHLPLADPLATGLPGLPAAPPEVGIAKCMRLARWLR
jgi:hypothetical protein